MDESTLKKWSEALAGRKPKETGYPRLEVINGRRVWLLMADPEGDGLLFPDFPSAGPKVNRGVKWA